MRSGVVASLVLVSLLGVDVTAEAQFGMGRRGEGEAVKHGWIFSLEQGKARAKESGKPLMVVIRCVP